MSTITFFGATGHLASPVVEAFLGAGYTVRALVRQETSARAKLPAAVQCIQGDLRDAAAVATALQGADYAYCNLSVRPGDKPTGWLAEREGLQTVLTEAKKAGVRRVGYLSSLIYRFNGTNGWRWWIFDVKQQAVETVRASGLDYVIFHPSNFMENFLPGGPYRQGNKVVLAGKSAHPMRYVAGADYARQVVAAFARLRPGESASYDVQGPEALTADAAATIFVENYRREKLTISRAPLGLLRVLGMVVPAMNYGYHIVYALNQYPEPFTAGPTNAALGAPTTTLASYARAVGS